MRRSAPAHGLVLGKEARRAHKSLSAHMAQLAAGRGHKRGHWPRGFTELFGSWEGELPAPADAPPEEVEPSSTT